MRDLLLLLHAVHKRLGFAPSVGEIRFSAFTRFSAPGKSNSDGWLWVPSDVSYASYGTWSANSKFYWPSARGGGRSTFSVPVDNGDEVCVSSEEVRAAGSRASAVWESALPHRSHPYAVRKRVVGALLRQSNSPQVCAQFGLAPTDLLLVPCFDTFGRLQTLQAIDGSGEKRFFRGASSRRGSFVIGGGRSIADLSGQKKLFVVEGVATGYAVRLMTRVPTVVAFSAGNLCSVCVQVRRHAPSATIVVAGDVDRSGTGQREARRAASIVKGATALPEVPAAWEGKSFDWSDFYLLRDENDSGGLP